MDHSTSSKFSATRFKAALILSGAILLTACGGGGGSDATAPPTQPTNPPTNPPNPATNHAPTISGTPATSVQAGQAYSFTPSAADQDGNMLAFSIQNKPSWAAFSTVSGALTGTPSAAGSTAGIVISVSDGLVTVPLAAFTLTVGAAPTSSVTINWSAPTANTDGTPLAQSDLVGYRIYYGTDQASLSQSVDVGGGTTLSRQITGLTPGTYYFAMTARTATEESGQTNLASKVVQ